MIAANSLLNTLEDDGNVKQTFAESIRTEARAEIENFRLVDSGEVTMSIGFIMN